MAEVEKDADKVRARCRTLSGFVREAWHILEPGTPLIWNWHLDALCLHLEAITFGLINRVLANVPPGSSKSLFVSVMWQAWEWGPAGMPETRWLNSSFNEGPVNRDTRKARDLMLSEWYQRLWPSVKLVRRAETSFSNTRTGTREGVPFTSITGQRGDRFVIDDPHSTVTAESEAERDKTVRQFREGAFNRLNDQERSAIVVIMQRLHEGDVSGEIIKRGGYVHLMIPMEFEIERRCETSIGWRDPRTYDGEPMDLQRFPQATLATMKATTTEYAWAGQYQQRPAPREGAMFKRHWFEFVRAIPAGMRRTVRGWDLAGSKRKTSAFTAGVKLTMVDRTFYLEGVVRERGSPGEVDAMILATASQDGGGVRISIPQDPGQAALSQKIAFTKLLIGYDVRFSPETGDKEQRAEPVSAQAEAGNVKIVKTGDPAKDAWIDPFLEELMLFPAGTLKDQVDALSRAFMEMMAWSRVPDITIGLPLQVGAGPQFVVGGLGAGPGYRP